MGSFLTNTLGLQNTYNPESAYNVSYQNANIDRQNQLYNQQQQLAQLLQQQATGQGGPAPEQLQYQMNINNQLAQQQGLMAGQRGLNPALAAKMAGQQAAQAGQQTAAQSALLGQQRQLGAQANLGNMYGQMQTGNLTQQQLYNQSLAERNRIGANVAQGNQQTGAALTGGIMKGIAGAAAAGAAAHGGLIGHYADGGITNQGGPQSLLGQGLITPLNEASSPSSLESDLASFGSGKSKLGMSPKSTMPLGEPTPMAGEPIQAVSASGLPVMNAFSGAYLDYRSGGGIPGKAKVKGDSYANDTVPIMVSPGEAVIPRTVMNSENAPDKAKDFVAALLAHKNMRKKS